MELILNIAEFHFIRPYWLLALIPAIALFFLLLKNKLNQGNWSKVCDSELLPYILQQKPAHKKRRWSLLAGALSSLLVIFALAGPTWEKLPSPIFRNDAALVIALDLSSSMDASDIKPSRLAKAKFKISDILKQRRDGQTALLAYAGDAFAVTPLTEDTETINNQLVELTTDIMPSQGSNASLALKKALELLKQAGQQQGDILLITDGANFDDTIEIVNSLANYRLSILGVGTAEGAPIKKASGGFVKDEQGNIVVPKLDSNELSRLSKKGNGLYNRITNSSEDIENLMDYWGNPREKDENSDDDLLIDQWNEKGSWLLLLVLPLAALQFRKGLLSIALLFILPFPNTSQAFEWNDLWHSKNQQAQKNFNRKNYQQAGEQFDTPEWKAAAQYKAGEYQQAAETLKNEKSAKGLYNRGNALAKAGNLQEAINAYSQSLQKDPDNEDAKFNQQLTKKVLKQQKKKEGDGEDKDDKDKDGEDRDDKDKDGEDKDDKDKDGEDKDDKDKDGEDKDDKDKVKYDESKQANEQWLRRIPEGSAGLLKRKFKYQYHQRRR